MEERVRGEPGGGGGVVRRVVCHEVAEVHLEAGGGGGRRGGSVRHGCAVAWLAVGGTKRSSEQLGFYMGWQERYL